MEAAMPSYHAHGWYHTKPITHMCGRLQTTLPKTPTITIQHVVLYKTYYNSNKNIKKENTIIAFNGYIVSNSNRKLMPCIRNKSNHDVIKRNKNGS